MDDDAALDRFQNLDEIAAQPTEENADLGSLAQSFHRLDEARASSHEGGENELESPWTGLNELDGPPPDENPDEDRWFRRGSIEEVRSEQRELSLQRSRSQNVPTVTKERQDALWTQLYAISYLVFFSILGTLARLGTQWIASYPDAPVSNDQAWTNFGGSLVLGFLQEDRALFARERRKQSLNFWKFWARKDPKLEADDALPRVEKRDSVVSYKTQLATKKTLPLYIGLSVGFCGSYTSFSSFNRDAFLALSNNLPAQIVSLQPRSAGWSISAVLAIYITEIILSLGGLSAGAHLAIATQPLLSNVSKIKFTRFMNPMAVFLGFGCWLGAVFLAIWPPHDYWRGQVIFALVFAPVGCLLRFYLALKLNDIIAKFPLGTFTANILGTVVLGMCYDLQHAPIGSVDGGSIIGCQVLQGVMDGFCGCLTTVSTWVAELKGLRKHNAYTYGLASITVAFSSLVVIMGSMRWTIGFDPPSCKIP